MQAQIDQTTGLPESWIVKFSKSKSLPYYFNVNTSQSQWEPPREANQDILKRYMAENFSTSGPLAPSDGRQQGKIRCAHLLVKHSESRRPSSWKEVRPQRTDVVQALIDVPPFLQGRDHEDQGGSKEGDP